MGDHLFTVVTDPCANGQHLLLNVSSIHEGAFYDDTCVFNGGEHPFIQRRSYVVYRSAQIQPAERIGRMVDGWVYKRHDPATEELANRMLAGVGVSRFTPRFVKEYLGL